MKQKRSPLDDVLYPPIAPYASGYLRVSPVHRIYYEESGNPKGKPVVFLHGGPGGATEPSMRRFFNPRKYRIVLFDQRGCGKSKPHGSLEDNTTWHLVDDIEKLREHLNIDKWQVFGGSWGSTLALAYAQAHPKKVTEMVLRGIFLLRDWELAWFYTSDRGTAALFPDAHEKLIAHIPPAERKDLIKAYYKRLTSKNRATMIEAARIVKLSPAGELLDEIPLPANAPTMVAFGGADLRTLYITTIGHRPEAERERFPLNGRVLVTRVAVAGRAEPAYQP